MNGMTVDRASKLLYWTDAQRRRIEVVQYDGSNRKVIINTGLTTPRGILADPLEGYENRLPEIN